MFAAILLALIGIADIVRAAVHTAGSQPPGSGTKSTTNPIRHPYRGAIPAIALAWALIVVIGCLGLGLPLWGILLEVVGAILWLATTRSGRESRAVGRWFPVAGLTVALVALLLTSGLEGQGSGFLQSWLPGDQIGALTTVPPSAVAAGIGSALFLIESANVIVTSALPAGSVTTPANGHETASSADGTPRRWWWQPRQTPVPRPEPLKGGRLIGPIERLLLAAFTLAGAWPVVAALVAAKGIIRFPEINKASDGDQAEYFLIGSLVSWASAFALAGLCWVLAIS